jgi:hypothetical protein
MTATKTETELVYATKIEFQAKGMTIQGYLFKQRIRYGKELINLCGIEVNDEYFEELKRRVEADNADLVMHREGEHG